MRAPGSYAGLTYQQAELLSLIRYGAVEGRTPSFREMVATLGLSSTSRVSRLVEALVERGYVRRLENRARAIVPIDEALALVRLPAMDALERYSSAEIASVLKRRGGYVVVELGA